MAAPARKDDTPREEVTLKLEAELLRRVRAQGGDLTARVERLLAEDVEREKRLDRSVAWSNEVVARYGNFADDHVEF